MYALDIAVYANWQQQVGSLGVMACGVECRAHQPTVSVMIMLANS